MDYKEKYESWLGFADEETKQELLGICGNEKEIEDRFYKDLVFGTGGLRGVMGAGSNRMNKYTVAKATKGLADYLCKNFSGEKSVAIAYDSRNNSRAFAETAAGVLCAAPSKYESRLFFSSFAPTPSASSTRRATQSLSSSRECSRCSVPI